MDDFDDSEIIDSDAQGQSSDSEFECVVVRRKRKSARKSKPTQRWTPEKPAKKPRTKKVVPAKDEDSIVDIESLDDKIFDDDQPLTDILDGTISKEDEFAPYDTVPADIFEPVLEEEKLTKTKSFLECLLKAKNLDRIPITDQLKPIDREDARKTKAEDLAQDDDPVTVIKNDANQLAHKSFDSNSSIKSGKKVDAVLQDEVSVIEQSHETLPVSNASSKQKPPIQTAHQLDTMDEFVTVDELEDDFMPVEEGYTEWTDSLILQFIDEYKARPVLWNTRHPLHKSKLRKKNTWIELSNLFKIKVPELKRKMACLLATYRKSFKKVKEVKEEMGLDYFVPWFAYRKFDFLKGIYKPVKKKKASPPAAAVQPCVANFEPEVVIKEEPIDNEEDPVPSTSGTDHEFRTDHELITPCTDDSFQSGTTPTLGEVFTVIKTEPVDEDDEPQTNSNDNTKKASKRKAADVGQSESPESEDSATKNSNSKDHFDVYGEYIAAKLRKLDWKSCAYVQKAFGDILFDAEMGKFK